MPEFVAWHNWQHRGGIYYAPVLKVEDFAIRMREWIPLDTAMWCCAWAASAVRRPDGAGGDAAGGSNATRAGGGMRVQCGEQQSPK